MPNAINRQNLSTLADHDDIFVLAGSNERFINFGVLTTSGDIASPIRVAANGVNVSNFGSLTTSGDLSSAVTVGDYFGDHFDNVTVTNFGTITTTGAMLFDDSLNFSGSISAHGNSNNVINYGTISATGFGAFGINTLGTNCLIVNYGTIESGSFGINAEGHASTWGGPPPPDETPSHITTINYGEIHLTGEPTGAGFGIAMIAWGAESISRNYGTILLDGVFSFIVDGIDFGFVDGVDAAYAGSLAENFGEIYATADIAIGMGIFFGGNLVRNYGTIQIDGSVSVGMHLDGGNSRGENYGTVLVSDETSLGVHMGRLPHHPNIGGAEFTNYGTIRTVGTAVLGSEYDDVVTNRGLLVGDVSLQVGDDTYVAGPKGRLEGVLTLGDGDDLVVVQRNSGDLVITDFSAGTATDDAIDLSAFGFRSLAQVLGHASQSGLDVVLNVGGSARIVLQNVSLASLATDDFVLGSHNAAAAASSQAISNYSAHDLWGF